MKSYVADYLLPDEMLTHESTPQPGPNRGRKGVASPAARWATPRVEGDGRRRWAAGMRALILGKLDELGTATVAELSRALGFRREAIGPRLTELAELKQVRSWRVRPRGPGQPRKVWTKTP